MAIFRDWVDACCKKPGGAIREMSPESDDSLGCFTKAGVVDWGLIAGLGGASFQVIVNS
jgi:hypothetical protein